MKIRHTFIVLFLFLFSLFSIGQTHDWDKLNTYFDVLAEHDKFMGSVAVWSDGEMKFTRAIGYADLESGEPNTTDSRFRVGSISKTFTATLVLLAVEEGLLKLDQTVETFFPSYEDSKDITIEHLLGHRSGIYNFTNLPHYLDWNTQPHSRADLLDTIFSQTAVFAPGEKAEYSNSNYVLLTFILEDIYKKSYADLLKIKITDPLNMENTYVGAEINRDREECYSYRYLGEWTKQSETDMSIPLGAGVVVSTPSDLIIFIKALFDKKLISETSLNAMIDLVDNYGLGIFSFPFYEFTSYGHTGGIDGFSSIVGYFPNEDVGVAMTSNGVEMSTNEILIAVLSEVFHRDYEIPEFADIEISSEQLQAFAGRYTSASFPLEIEISIAGKTLLAQATGQPQITLTATSENTFEYAQAGLVLVFDVDKNQMNLNQGGMEYLFTKK